MEIRLPLDDGTAVKIDCTSAGSARVYFLRPDMEDLFIGSASLDAVSDDLQKALSVGPDFSQSGDSHRLAGRMFWASWTGTHTLIILGNENEFFMARMELTPAEVDRWRELLASSESTV